MLASGSASGFSLIEVLVASGVLMVLVGGLAAIFGMSVEKAMASRVRTMEVVLARSKLEQLVGLAWGVRIDAAGAVEFVTDETTDLASEAGTASGAGTRSSPADSLEQARTGYVDYLDAYGRWVGTGLSPPARAIYVRRWSIAREGSGLTEMLVLRVAVERVVEARPAMPGVPVWTGVRLGTVRVRKIL